MTYRIMQSVKRTVVLMALAICALGSESLSQVNLRCEYLVNPLGVDAQKPRLSWVLEDRGQNTESNSQKSGTRGVKQSAYQVLVASSEELLKQDTGLYAQQNKMKDSARI
jgi:alpha-L-rhamnosidase